MRGRRLIVERGASLDADFIADDLELPGRVGQRIDKVVAGIGVDGAERGDDGAGRGILLHRATGDGDVAGRLVLNIRDHVWRVVRAELSQLDHGRRLCRHRLQGGGLGGETLSRRSNRQRPVGGWRNRREHHDIACCRTRQGWRRNNYQIRRGHLRADRGVRRDRNADDHRCADFLPVGRRGRAVIGRRSGDLVDPGVGDGCRSPQIVVNARASTSLMRVGELRRPLVIVLNQNGRFIGLLQRPDQFIQVFIFRYDETVYNPHGRDAPAQDRIFSSASRYLAPVVLRFIAGRYVSL